MWLDGELLLDNNGASIGGSFFTLGSDEVSVTHELSEGRPVRLDIEYRIDAPGLPVAAVCLGARLSPSAGALDRAVRVAEQADVAIVCVGTNNNSESEGEDRRSLGLPGDQDLLIRSVAEANPRTVVVVNSGAPVTMDWVEDVAAILQVWYPGQEGGDAIADVLLGRVDASGRLPTTFPKRIEDTPAYPTFPGADGVISYAESIFMGYRHYDDAGPEPLFPFGHGLSFTTFDYRELSADLRYDGVDIGLQVSNTGSRRGSTVVQVYVRRPDSVIVRADQELKGFEKIALEPGETAWVSLRLPPTAFRHWDLERGTWCIEEGGAEIAVGASSRDIRVRTRVGPIGPELGEAWA